MISTMAYVLVAFPLPSETFIADEGVSLYDVNVKPCILYMQEGNRSKIHPSAQKLLEKADSFKVGVASKLQAIRSFSRLFLRSPIRVLGIFKLILNNPHRWLYIQALSAADWCVRQKVEFLHAHFAGDNLIYASAISDWTGIPYGVTTHRYDIFEDPLERKTVIQLFEKASAVITISEFNRSYMVNKYGLSYEKIDIVHCGIDLERFRFIERSMRQPAQKLRMLNVGRLVSQKAQDILIKALELVKFKKIPFTLEIIGGGPMEEELRNLTNKLNIANEVIFHGVQTEDFVRERLAAVDLFVLSSRSEGLPVVLMEAMAVGTPVIATKIFGIPELVNDGVSGLLVPPDDPHALAEAICSAYADPSLLCAMQFAGRRAVETSFERGACTLALTRIWNNALA